MTKACNKAITSRYIFIYFSFLKENICATKLTGKLCVISFFFLHNIWSFSEQCLLYFFLFCDLHGDL